MADDTLDANKMKVNPGGKQRKMRDTIWGGMVRLMNDHRGVYTQGDAASAEGKTCQCVTTADQMRATLASMDDFKNEKSSCLNFILS